MGTLAPLVEALPHPWVPGEPQSQPLGTPGQCWEPRCDPQGHCHSPGNLAHPQEPRQTPPEESQHILWGHRHILGTLAYPLGPLSCPQGPWHTAGNHDAPLGDILTPPGDSTTTLGTPSPCWGPTTPTTTWSHRCHWCHRPAAMSTKLPPPGRCPLRPPTAQPHALSTHTAPLRHRVTGPPVSPDPRVAGLSPALAQLSCGPA